MERFQPTPLFKCPVCFGPATNIDGTDYFCPRCEREDATPVVSYPARTGVSILQDWVANLPIRYQGTLLAALRGCDGIPKEDASKTLCRAVRVMVLNPADPRELTYAGGYMSFEIDELMTAVSAFGKSMDHYPLHFVMHLLHALEVIGYEYPDDEANTNSYFLAAYMNLVGKLHLHVEERDELRERMIEDRVKNGTV